MGGTTFIEINYDKAWVDSSLAGLASFEWLFSWGMYIFILVALAIMFWIFFDSINKKKDQQALVPRILSMIGFFAIIPAFIFRFTGNADGITCFVRLNAEVGTPSYPGPLNWNVNWLVRGYGPIIAIIALVGVVLSIVSIVMYASKVHRAKPATEFVRAFNNRMSNLENQVEASKKAAPTPAPQRSSLSGAVASSGNARRSKSAATIIDRQPQAATIIDVPDSGATLTVTTGTGRGRTYNLPTHDVTVGRDPSCFVSISDGKVSREHVKFLYNNGMWSVLDAGSVNGTFLNGDRLVGQQGIENGAQLSIGDTVLVFGSHK